jgi:hypothetical protein
MFAETADLNGGGVTWALTGPESHQGCHFPAGRDDALSAVLRRKGVLLTTYGMALHNSAALTERPTRGGSSSAEDDESPLWDAMVLDEACTRPLL